MPKKKPITDSVTSRHWTVNQTLLDESGYEGEALITEHPFDGDAVKRIQRFYPLFDPGFQSKLLAALMLVTGRDSAMSFTEDWGFLVEARSMPLRHLVDAAASVRWIYELLEALNDDEPQSYWIKINEENEVEFDNSYAPSEEKIFIPEPYQLQFQHQFFGPVLLKFAVKGGLATGQYSWSNTFSRTKSSKSENIRDVAHECVCDWITDMLEPVHPVLSYNANGRIEQSVLLASPWAVIAHQLFLKAIGAASIGVCKRPTCRKTFERIRSTKQTCSEACEAWCRRNLK